MGLLDWFRRKLGDGGSPAAARPRPKVVSGLEDGSTMVAVDVGNGTLMMMDRDAYEYQYGDSKLPHPARRDLDELLPRVTRVRVLSGGLSRGEPVPSPVLLDTTDPVELKSLAGCFAIDEDPRSFSHCGCMGGPTIELFAGPERIAAIGLQHGRAIRWGAWKDDANLVDGTRLTGWLKDHGVDADLLAVLYRNPFPYTGGRVEGAGPDLMSRAEQRLMLAEIHFQRGDAEGALALCTAEVDANPSLGVAYATRGVIQLQKSRFDAALADLTRAIDLGVREAQVYFSRAVALDNLELSLDALADCTTAIEIAPDHANAYNSRGLIRMKLGRYDEARGDIEKAIELAPGWILPLANRAQLAQASGDLHNALADYTRLVDQLRARPNPQQRPMLAGLLRNRAVVRHLLGDPARAEEDWQEAVRLDPSVAGPAAGGAEAAG